MADSGGSGFIKEDLNPADQPGDEGVGNITSPGATKQSVRRQAAMQMRQASPQEMSNAYMQQALMEGKGPYSQPPPLQMDALTVSPSSPPPMQFPPKTITGQTPEQRFAEAGLAAGNQVTQGAPPMDVRSMAEMAPTRSPILPMGMGANPSATDVVRGARSMGETLTPDQVAGLSAPYHAPVRMAPTGAFRPGGGMVGPPRYRRMAALKMKGYGP